MVQKTNITAKPGSTKTLAAAFFQASGAPLTGDTAIFTCWRESDGDWYTSGGWSASPGTINMVEQGEGWYYYEFSVPSSNDTYHVTLRCNSADTDKVFQYTITAVEGLY